jgi:hypothetical protein
MLYEPIAQGQPRIGPPALPAVARILARHDRPAIEAFLAIAIDLLDTLDGDPDAETGNDVEDDFVLTDGAIERAISDPRIDSVDQDEGAFVEWHTKPSNRLRSGQAEFTLGHEDDEDDDPAEEDDDSGQCDEDGINTLGDLAMHALQSPGPGCSISDEDGQSNEDEVAYGNPYFGRKGAGCEISDPDSEHDGREPERAY